VVEGEPGIGKSRLVLELAAGLGPGWVAMTGHGIDLAEGAVPYGVAAELVQALVHLLGDEHIRQLLGPHAAGLGPLVPPALHGTDGSLDRLAVYPACRALVEGAARQHALCLIVEDLHWADVASVDLLTYLAKTVADVAVLLVVTTRPLRREGRHVARQVAELTRRPVGHHLWLGPLDRAAVEQQTAALLGRPPDTETLARVHRLGDGVPLYVEELVNGPATTGDTALDRLNLTLRLERMNATTRRVLDAAAVGDGRLTTARLTAVTQLDGRAVTDALGDAVRAGVMDPSDGAQSVRFHHALLREAVLQDLFPDDRRAWHLAWAEELKDDLVAAAHHWYEAGEAERALHAAVRAGEQALALSAPFEAAVHYRRVLDLWWVVDDPERLAGVSRRFALTRGSIAVALTADWAAVAALAEREVSRTVPADPVITMWGRLVRARVLRDAGVAHQLAVAPEEIDETVEMLCEQPLEDDLVVSSLSFLGHTTYQTSSRTFAQIVDRIDKAQWQREGADAEPEWSLSLQGERALRDGDANRAIELARTRLARLSRRSLRGSIQFARATAELGWFLQATGEYRAAAVAAHEALRMLQGKAAGGLGWMFAVAQVAPIWFALGEWDRCRELAIPLLDPPTADGSISKAAALLMDVAVARGDLAEAQRHADIAFGCVSPTTSALPDLYAAPRVAAVGLTVARGHVGRAQQQLLELLQMPTLMQASWINYQAVLLAARLAGDHPGSVPEGWLDAVDTAAELVPSQGRLGEAWGAELDALSARVGGIDTAASWERAVNAWDDIEHVPHTAKCRLDLARRHLQDQRPEDAAGQLRLVLKTAEHLGAAPLADQARSLALAGRLRLDVAHTEAPAKGLSPLTGRETEVLRLVAQGQTNAQIGSALFMSPKTVSVHVSRIIAKLGVANRTEATTVALRSGLIGE
jgi:DNA-binding CsgD family transcriptional regulator